MQPLPPRVQALVDEFVALAPPLAECQRRVIRQALVPYMRPAVAERKSSH